jgi:hypothetical protein
MSQPPITHPTLTTTFTPSTLASNLTLTTTTTPFPSILASELALTTTFTPPAQCTQSGHATILDAQQYYVWYNEIVPVPNTTITSCYPSQFAASYLADRPPKSLLPAFSTLICPEAWVTAANVDVTWLNGTSNATYIACCPT